MSEEQAKALVARMTTDDEFQRRLLEATPEQRREMLREEGYGDVTRDHVTRVILASADGEVTDEELAAVAGGGATASAVATGFGTVMIAAAIFG